MHLATRTILILTLAFPLVLSAQEAAPAVEAPAEGQPALEAQEAVETTPPATETAAPSNEQIRSEFGALLRQHPPELARLLTLDPALLTNEEFLTRYPELAEFVAANPAVRRNPHYFLPYVEVERRSHVMGDLLEGLAIFSTFLLIALALGWFIRTLIEQKRWSRLSRTQSEVHNKILDRFGTSEELLAYVRTPAGARFLESAPIPLHADRPAAQNQPFARVLWSVQIGVVVAAAALGMLLVSLRLDEEGAQALFALGAIGLCVGIGFIGSAAVSIFLSRRLGLWEPPSVPPSVEPANDPGLVG